MSNVPLPEPFSDMQYCRPSGVFGRLAGYTADQMHAHAAAVTAAKDAEIAGLRAELIKSIADNAALRADAIDRQNNVVAPLREQVRVLEDALSEWLAFQSAPTQPTIHDWGRWRRVLHARAALEQKP